MSLISSDAVLRKQVSVLGVSAILLVVVFLQSSLSGAQTYTVLHHFNQTDGWRPNALFRDSAGVLYGTTAWGGQPGGTGGTAFKLDLDRTFTVLHRFPTGTDDGFRPEAGVIVDPQGNVYGTTTASKEEGTVFKIDPSGVETILHRFKGGDDGSCPCGTLIHDRKWTMYGTAVGGGPYNGGFVYKIGRNRAGAVLFNFDGSHGSGPWGGLVRDDTGNLYGTTVRGGAFDEGTVYKLAADGAETVIYSFTGGQDGTEPGSELVIDNNGNLYGTTDLGGANNAGTVFKVDPTGLETVLHAFSFPTGDGAFPTAGLTIDAAGSLYGTANLGGTSNNGVVFEIDSFGTYTILYNFNGNDGARPNAALLVDSDGTLFGTTSEGGLYDAGVIFRLKP